MLYQKHDELLLVLDNIKYLVILEVIKYDFASFYCNKVDIFGIWEVSKYENASFLCNKVDILVLSAVSAG